MFYYENGIKYYRKELHDYVRYFLYILGIICVILLYIYSNEKDQNIKKIMLCILLSILFIFAITFLIRTIIGICYFTKLYKKIDNISDINNKDFGWEGYIHYRGPYPYLLLYFSIKYSNIWEHYRCFNKYERNDHIFISGNDNGNIKYYCHLKKYRNKAYLCESKTQLFPDGF